MRKTKSKDNISYTAKQQSFSALIDFYGDFFLICNIFPDYQEISLNFQVSQVLFFPGVWQMQLNFSHFSSFSE